MEMKDEILLPGNIEYIYECLNNIQILKTCIPGCETLEEESKNVLIANVVLKIGPIKAKFKGKINIDLSEAPSKYSLIGEGNGGVAGIAKGGADIELVEQGDKTLLRYDAKADVQGKIAQLGSRLILSTAKKLSKSFFQNFEDYIKNDTQK